MVLNISVKPGDNIYTLSKDGALGTHLVSHIRITTVNDFLSVAYCDKDDKLICTQHDIDSRKSYKGVIFFSNKHIRDAYAKFLAERNVL